MFKNVNCSHGVREIVYRIDGDSITAAADHYGEVEIMTENFVEFLQGFPFEFSASDAEFVAEWYPEYIHAAAEHWYFYPYSWMNFTVMSEAETAEMLDYCGVSEDEYQENYGSIIRDIGLSGVLVVGE